MRRLTRVLERALLLGVVLVGCALPQPDPPNCSERTAYYPDTDGDGLGEPGEVYIGCAAPSGWVDNSNDAVTNDMLDTAVDTALDTGGPA